MSKISVIIPAFNSSKTIEQAINSALTGQISDIEVVVVDDGSQDNTAEIVSKLQNKDPRIKLIKKKNGGQSQARNMGLKAAQGEFVAFLDHDDLWLPGKTEKQLSKFVEGIDLVYSDSFVDRGGEKTLWSGTNKLYSGQPLLELAENNFIPTLTVIMRRSLFDKIPPFNESLRYGEDYDIWFRTLLSGSRIDYVPEPLATYNFGVGISEGMRGRYPHLLSLHQGWLKERNLPDQARKIILRKIKNLRTYDLHERFREAVAEQNFQLAADLAWDSFKNSPIKIKYLLSYPVFKFMGIFK